MGLQCLARLQLGSEVSEVLVRTLLTYFGGHPLSGIASGRTIAQQKPGCPEMST
jgi:hypothetical protein